MTTNAVAEPVPSPAARARPPESAPARGHWGFGHVPALDGLRGAAVLAVLMYHGGHLTGGYLGVDLFFVLSGFLITSLLLAERLTTGTINLKAFWSRRVRRLLPALLVLMVGIALYATFISRSVDLGNVRADGLAALFYVANWHTILHGTSYWDLALAPSPLQHVWSLAIEEQFYLVWPLVVVLLARGKGDPAGRVWRVASIGAAVSAAWFIGLHLLGASDTRVYEGTDTRAAGLLLGAALAAWRYRGDKRRPPRPAPPAGSKASPYAYRWDSTDWLIESIGVSAALFLGLLWFLLDGQSKWLYRGGLPMASFLAVVVVAVASRPGSPILGWAFSAPPLRKLGLISYGLYLWHWPIYQALNTRNGNLPFLGHRFLQDPTLLLLKLGLSLLAAIVSYRLIESPIRHGAVPRPFGSFAAAGGIVVAAMAIVVSTAGAVSVPGPSNIVGLARVHVPGGPEVVFAGDSVTLSLVSRVANNPVRFGVNPINRALIGCSIAYAGKAHKNFDGSGGPTPPSCAPNALRDLSNINPAVVFFMTGARPNDYAEIDGQFVRPCDALFDDAYRKDLESLVHQLQATGAPVVLGTTPHSGKNSFTVEGSEQRIDCVGNDVKQVAKDVPGTSVVDPNELLCPHEQPCVEVLDGAPVRSEGLHFDPGPGGDAVADWMVERILAAAHVSPAAGTKVRTH